MRVRGSLRLWWKRHRVLRGLEYKFNNFMAMIKITIYLKIWLILFFNPVKS